MNDAPRSDSIEEILLNSLKHDGLKKEKLEELVNVVSGFYQAGLTKIKVFPKGIPPVVDGLELQASVDVKQLPDFVNLIINEPKVSGFVYFPYGIPFVTDARLNIVLGSRPTEGYD